MKIVIIEKNGKKLAFELPDDAPDENAELGIPIEGPDLTKINWASIRTEVENALVDAHVFTLSDLRQHNKLVTARENINRVIFEAVRRYYTTYRV